MQTSSGRIALVEGQQSYAITFAPAFGVAPTSFLPSIFIPNSNGEITAVSLDLSSLTGTGCTVWLNAPPTAASVGGFITWRASNVPTTFPTPAGQIVGSIALVDGQQSYSITFPVPFAGIPRSFFSAPQMPNSTGEVFAASPDLATLSPNGVTVWLSGVPTSASAGGYLNWLAEGVPALSAAPTVSASGRRPIVAGQRNYDIVFTNPFAAPPVSIFPTVLMPNSSGEVMEASVDYSTLTATGCTIWLNGEPTATSAGGFIDWIAQGAPRVTAATSGITVPQLFHRIARRARTGDFTKLSLTEQTDLAEAANSGLQRLYNLLPTYFKELTDGFVLPGPLAIYGVGVTRHSKTVTPYTFSREQIGRTVVLDGDPQWNQVIGTGTLLNPYMGASGTVNGIVYGNAVFSDIYPLDRIIGDPRLTNQNFGILGTLQMYRGNSSSGFPLLYQQSIGQPCVWWVQTFGNSQGNSPSVVLRFAPAPNQDYGINCRIGFWPKRLTMADYLNASTLVVPDQFIETCLIPLCLQAFMTSPAYVTKGDEKDLWQRAQDAEAFLKSQPGQVGAPSNRIFTPLGY